MAAEKKDFFISYNAADKQWAEWIAATLEAAGYTTILQEWDFKAGGNFVLEMDRAMRESQRTIAVLSPNYLAANYTAPEWAEKFARDPQGSQGRLVPLRVAACELEGILSQVIYVDMVDTDEDTAQKRLLAHVGPGRNKPQTPPPFPGGASAVTPSQPKYRPSEAGVEWRTLADPPQIRWQRETEHSQFGNAVLELHAISLESPTLGARALRELPTQLTAIARGRGLFEQSEAVYESVDEDKAAVMSPKGYSAALGERGMAVYRDREIITWTSLPNDELGSIFDEEDIGSRLAALLALDVESGLFVDGLVAFAVSVEPIARLMVGSASDMVASQERCKSSDIGSAHLW